MGTWLRSLLVAQALGFVGLVAMPAFGRPYLDASADEPVVAEPGPQSGAPPVSWATERARSQVELGRSALSATDIDKAAKYFRAAAEFDATYGPAYVELAKLEIGRGDSAAAKRVLEVGFEHIPDFGEGFELRAELRSRAGDVAAALQDLRHAIRLSPHRSAPYRSAIGVCVRANRLPQALAFARQWRAALSQSGHVQTDRAGLADATVWLKALTRLLGEVDPVQMGTRLDGGRKALALGAL